MKVLISDYAGSMMPTHDLETRVLREGLGDDVKVEVYAYTDERRDEFFGRLADADALVTAFVQMDEEAFEHAPRLKVVSINATGYDNVDLAAASARGIGVCPVGEYCTRDVSEAAIGYMFALNKHFKLYQRQVEVDHRWDFAEAPAWPRLEDQTLGIVGFGKIGKCTARKARGVVKDVIIATDVRDYPEFADYGVERVSKEELLSRADIVVNHMNLNETNVGYFDDAAFDLMAKRQPIFINLGRGLCVDEAALVRALDEGKIRAYGADVLVDEHPDLAHHPLVGRDNVMITPHSAFYSSSSLADLQRISCENVAHFLRGEKDKVFKLVN